METNYKPTKSIVEIMEETRENFKKKNGKLLTEEEAVELTNTIKKELRKDKQ